MKLKGRNNSHKRDVLTKEEKEKLQDIQYKYCNEKGITRKEQIKRRCCTILDYGTFDGKDLLSHQNEWCDISINQKDDAFAKFNRVIYIPVESSKTGRPREIVSPLQII